MRLKGKRTIVTGGTRGIGLAIAERYAKEGAEVIITGRDKEVAEQAAADIRKDGGVVHAYALDVQNSDEVDGMIRFAMDTMGGIDVLVANAGICEPAHFLDITEESWDRHIAINLKGVFLCGQAVAKHMVDAGTKGKIINMTSVNGLAGEADQAHYNASKGAITLLTYSMAIDLAVHGINVNGIAPGFVDTRLTRPLINVPSAINEYVKTIPLGRYGRPDEMSGAAVFLASEDSDYVTGHVLVVDGGQVIKLS